MLPTVGPRASRRTRAIAASVLLASGLALAALAARQISEHVDERTPGFQWTAGTAIAMAAAVASCVLLAATGAWFGWQSARNPIGWWLAGAGIAYALWLIGVFWEHPNATWLETYLPLVFRVLVALAVLAWPTGRLEPRWRRPVVAALGAYVGVSVVAGFVGDLPGPAPWNHPEWLLPTIGGETVALVREAVFAVLFLVVAPTAFVVAVGRRRKRLPTALRAIATPAFAAAWVLTSADLWLFVSNVLARGLEAGGGRDNLLTSIRAVVDYGRFGAVPVLLLAGERARRRALADRRGQSTVGEVELRADVGHRTVDQQLGTLLDPRARLLLARSGGTWVTTDGSPATEARAGSRLVSIVDTDGVVVAAIEVPEDASVAATSVEAVVATVQTDLVRSRRMAEAAAALAGLRELQRAVLDRQDQARRRLERDLHDGVQQQLVALSLEVGLARRAEAPGPPDRAVRAQLAESLAATATAVRRLVDEDRPAVLDGGLAGALSTLAASLPLPTSITTDGDVGPDDPAALVLWYAANEAVGNAMKHAAARHVRLDLRVDVATIELVVADDGIGGVDRTPVAIERRIDPIGGTVAVVSPPGEGTTLTIRVAVDPLVSRLEEAVRA